MSDRIESRGLRLLLLDSMRWFFCWEEDDSSSCLRCLALARFILFFFDFDIILLFLLLLLLLLFLLLWFDVDVDVDGACGPLDATVSGAAVAMISSGLSKILFSSDIGFSGFGNEMKCSGLNSTTRMKQFQFEISKSNFCWKNKLKLLGWTDRSIDRLILCERGLLCL